MNDLTIENQASQGVLSRRGFIRISALVAGGAGLGTGAIKWLLERDQLRSVQERRILMGSVATLTVISADENTAHNIIKNTFNHMQTLESILSRFQPESQLSRLNREGQLENPAAELVTVLERANEMSRISQGAFDVTVEPLLSYYRHVVQMGTAFETQRVDELRERIDYRLLKVDSQRIELQTIGMQITLDGIAKGYIIDQGCEFLRHSGYSKVLVDVGGDLHALGTPDDQGWRAGIQSPREGWIGVTELVDRAMATSGDYVNTFSQDYELHHILDPRTGISPAKTASVSVIAHTALDADALSTTLMILGPEHGLRLIDTLPGVEALLVGKDLSTYKSSAMNIEFT